MNAAFPCRPGASLQSGPTGAGSATVVLLCGAGDNMASRTAVQRQLAAVAPVVGYDRAGIGDIIHLAAPPGPQPSRAQGLARLRVAAFIFGPATPRTTCI